MDNLVTKLRTWYLKDGLSGVDIAHKLDLKIRQVYRIMERSDIKRRKSSESNNIKFLKKRPTFKIKNNLTSDDRALRACGVMLYWAEGWKGGYLLDFANSDPSMIKIYLRFLRNICGVNEDKLRVYMYCYANQNILTLKRFWSRITYIKLSQFTKPYVRKDFRKDKIDKMPYGLVHVRYADKKLYDQISKWHDQLVKKWERGGVDKRT
jgi:hypothetical protein